MEIGKLNQRITLLKNATCIDNIGNHRTQQEELYSCWAAVSVRNSVENSDNGTAKEIQTLQLMIRQNSETIKISTTANCISFCGMIYDIVSISPNFEYRNYLKITAKSRKAGENGKVH